MRKLRRGLALALCLLLSLTACAAPEPGDTPPSDTGKTVILTDAESYSVTAEQMVPIVASLEGGEGELSFSSADETVATVNKYGKVVGRSAGTTEITITAPDGTRKTVPVTVSAPVYENVLRLTLNVLYNDAQLGCSNTEYGPYIEICEDGQYTLSFDCTTHLSESSRKMGVTALRNLTAVFLYDQAVRDGDQKASAVTACEIRWDSVCVNGQELTLKDSTFRSALKANGIFDTNDPLNAWDGSAVEEVSVDEENHVLNINVEEPVTISVTFTIRGLTFAEQ